MEVPNIPSCQSCGMPMPEASSFGTEQDGKPSNQYCKFCYQAGKFVEPKITKEQMIKRISEFMVKKVNLPEDKVKEIVPKTISALKRWTEPPKE